MIGQRGSWCPGFGAEGECTDFIELNLFYKIKQALFELGPSGYPFEMFIGELLKYQGYDVQVGKIVKGLYVKHEVDVIAIKDNRTFMVECKFHSSGSKKSDVKVPLYIDSRFRDIEKQLKKI